MFHKYLDGSVGNSKRGFFSDGCSWSSSHDNGRRGALGGNVSKHFLTCLHLIVALCQLDHKMGTHKHTYLFELLMLYTLGCSYLNDEALNSN